jgi:hypothetical protein
VCEPLVDRHSALSPPAAQANEHENLVAQVEEPVGLDTEAFECFGEFANCLSDTFRPR